MIQIEQNSIHQCVNNTEKVQQSQSNQNKKSQQSFDYNEGVNQQDTINQPIGLLFKNDSTEVIQFYNTRIKYFTVKKYFNCENEWENEVDILKQLQDTDIALKLINNGKENNRYFLEQICGQKNFYKLKSICMPYILKEERFNIMYDIFISIQFIRLFQKLNKLHQLNFANSDIKPQNIVIGYDFEPYFIDLGGAIKLDINIGEYLKQKTLKYNLFRYHKDDLEFQYKKQVIVCEYTQLSLTILFMIIPNLNEYNDLFDKQEIEKWISKQNKQFPKTTQLLEIFFSLYLENYQIQCNYKTTNCQKIIDDQIDIDLEVDFESFRQIMIKITDIQFNSQNNIFEVKTIDQYSFNIFKMIQVQFQNIDISFDQVDVLPFEQYPIFEKMVKKYQIRPIKYDNKFSFGFGQLYNMDQIVKWILSPQSKNQIFRFGINSQGDTQLLCENLPNAFQNNNIKLKICFISLQLVKLILECVKNLNNFQIESFEIYFIKEVIVQINLQQINENFKLNKIQNEHFEKILNIQNKKMNELQQKNDVQNITIKKGNKQEQNVIKNQIEQNQNLEDFTELLDNKNFIPLYLKHYQPYTRSTTFIDYSQLDFLYELKKSLYVTLKISNQKDFVENFQQTVENILNEFLESDLKQSNIIHKLTIQIKYILKSSFKHIFTQNQIKKNPINLYLEIQKDPQAKEFIEQIGQDKLNSLIIIQNIEREFYDEKKMSKFDDLSIKVNKQIIFYLDFLLNAKKNHLNNKYGKLILQFNELIINEYIYNIITYYLENLYNKSHLIDIIFYDCYYDQKIIKSIIQLSQIFSIDFDFYEKNVEKNSKMKYSIKFNFYEEKEKRKQIKIQILKSVENDKTIENLSENEYINQQDLERKNNLIDKNDIINIFEYNQTNIQETLLKVMHLNTIKTEFNIFKINYFIKNLKTINIDFQNDKLADDYQPNQRIIINNLSYEISKLNQILLNSTGYSKQQKLNKEKKLQFEKKHYLEQFRDNLVKILQTQLFKQDGNSGEFILQMSEIFQIILNKSEQLQISQDTFSFELIMQSEQFKLSSFHKIISSLSQLLSDQCIKQLNRIFIRLGGMLLREQRKEDYFQKIDAVIEEKINIELIVIDFQDCCLEQESDQNYAIFISNIQGNNIYVYLPTHLCSSEFLIDVISRKQRAKNVLLDTQKSQEEYLALLLLQKIIKLEIKNKVIFRIQTKRPQIVFDQVNTYLKCCFNIQQYIQYEISEKSDELTISYYGQIPFDNNYCEFQIKLYERDEKKLDIPIDLIKQKILQNNNSKPYSKWLAVSISYEGRTNITPNAKKSFISIQSPISLQIESDLQNFLPQHNQKYLEMEFELQSGDFDQKYPHNSKKQENFVEKEQRKLKQNKNRYIDILLYEQKFYKEQIKYNRLPKQKKQLLKYQYQSEIEQFNEEENDFKEFEIVEQRQLYTDSEDEDVEAEQKKIRARKKTLYYKYAKQQQINYKKQRN